MLHKGTRYARRKNRDTDKQESYCADQPNEQPGQTEANKELEEDLDILCLSEQDEVEPIRLAERATAIKQKVKKLAILGRSVEKEQIVDALLNADSVSTYIFGKPGTGKTFVAQKVLRVFEEEGIEVYRTNILLDTVFTSESPDNVSDTVILLADECENRSDTQEYCERKRQLLQGMKKKGRTQEPSIKTLFISNSAKKTGIRFRPYTKENLKEILSETAPRLSLEDRLLRISLGTEKGDIRVALQQNIGTLTGKPSMISASGSTAPITALNTTQEGVQKGAPEKTGQLNSYHQFVMRRIKEGANSARQIYGEFISEMKQKGLPVISRDQLQCIVDEHMNRE